MKEFNNSLLFALQSPARRKILLGSAASLMMFALPKALAGKSALPPMASDVKTFPVKTQYDLMLARTPVNITGSHASAITLNGTIPGPLLHFREGDEVTVNLTNQLQEATAIHWHGLLVPNSMDGVPGVTFPGVQAGETFQYRFKLRQSGTYWYHSHAILQEPAGFYAPLIIDPASHDPIQSDRDYVILLSDWIDTPPERVLANLKKVDGYYNFRRQTITELRDQLRAAGSGKERQDILSERLAWAKMRMDPTDYSDAGPEWNLLMQGAQAQDNWTALFAPGERVRLRFINGAAMNFFDVSIPGLDLTVVAADGQNVSPVKVRELRIGNGETYDVIVQPREKKAYTIFAASMARTGYARGTLAPELGMQAPIPDLGPRPVRKISEMAGIHDGGEHSQHGSTIPEPEMNNPPGMKAASQAVMEMDHAAHGKSQQTVLESAAASAATIRADAGQVAVRDKLDYQDLRALQPGHVPAGDIRTIQMDLTGDMNRYFWSINGKKLAEAKFFEAKLNEPLRFRLTNKTMMEHPMHLHGTFFRLENGQGAHAPLKHTVIVKPGETVTLYAAFDESGGWVFHCHLFYHAATGMVQAVIVK